MVGRDGSLCGVMTFWGKTVVFRSFPLISAHIRSFWLCWALVLMGKKPCFSVHFYSFPFIPVRFSRGGRWCWWAKNLFPRSFPFGSVRMDQSVWLTHMCSITLKSRLASVSGIGKGRGSAGRWQSYCQEDDLTNISATKFTVSRPSLQVCPPTVKLRRECSSIVPNRRAHDRRILYN